MVICYLRRLAASRIILHLALFFSFRNACSLACCLLWCTPFVYTPTARIIFGSFWYFNALSFPSVFTRL